MGRPRTIVPIGIAVAGLLIVLITTAVLGLRLLANREMVNAFIARKTLQATGGTLNYDRLEIQFLPLLRLKSGNIRLHRPDAFDIKAASLSVYPAIGSLLKGEVRIRRLTLASPSGTVSMGAAKQETPAAAPGPDLAAYGISTGIQAFFNAITVIDPATEIRIDGGSLTLAITGQPAMRITGIDVHMHRVGANLAIGVQCQANAAGNLALQADVDTAARQASGQITLTNLNVRPLLQRADLPGGIAVADTRASADLDFEIDGPEALRGRFDLRFPSLTLHRLKSLLTVDQAIVSGTIAYGGQRLSVSIDELQAEQPDLRLSAGAVLTTGPQAGSASLDLHAAAADLDVAVAGAIGRSMAGDLQAVRTAFEVAREGHLSSVVFDAQLAVDRDGWRLKQMTAAGSLSRGRVTVPGNLANLEQLEGDLVYDGQRLEFTNASGHFKGADVAQLQAAIDWSGEPTLAIRSSAVDIDSAPLFDWLTGFGGLSSVKKSVASINGRATLSALKIDGPLASPQQWTIAMTGMPQGLRLASPVLPFTVRLSGGEITYEAGRKRAQGVTATFLDGSLRVDYQSKGIATDESMEWRIDGSMGQETIDWLSTVVPIPEHLKMKPPVQISDARVAWNHAATIAFTGGVQTGGGVTLFTDVEHAGGTWQIHSLTFADGHSHVTASANLLEETLTLAFAGNFEKQTADRLFRNNRTLSGRLEGDFQTVINTRSPIDSQFFGRLSGQGLQIHQLIDEPIELRQFSVDGHGNQIKIDSTQISLLNCLMNISGMVDRGTAGLTFDLDVSADHLDDALIRALLPDAKEAIDTTTPTADQSPSRAVFARGEIHLQTTGFTYGDRTWSDVQADIGLADEGLHIRIHEANLCGISTTGDMEFSPHGLGFTITPAAQAASLEDTLRCLAAAPVKTDARFDLGGVIALPPTRENPLERMTGQLQLSSINGRIITTSTLVKIVSYLNASRLLADRGSDFSRNGLSFHTAEAQAQIGEGKLQLTEFVMDGETMKITGQGRVALSDATADITVLVAPLRTVDRLVDRLPGISYLTGGSLISIPFRLTGPLSDLNVTPLPPAAVGKGMLDIMQRALKAPVKLVQGAAGWVSGETTGKDPSQMTPAQTSPERED